MQETEGEREKDRVGLCRPVVCLCMCYNVTTRAHTPTDMGGRMHGVSLSRPFSNRVGAHQSSEGRQTKRPSEAAKGFVCVRLCVRLLIYSMQLVLYRSGQ